MEKPAASESGSEAAEPAKSTTVAEWLRKGKLERRDLVEIGAATKYPGSVLYRVSQEDRQALVNRITEIGRDAKSNRTAISAMRALAGFDRINLEYRLAGFGDFAADDAENRDGSLDLDPEFLMFARSQAILFADGHRATGSKIVRAATPLTYATFASRGKWRPARHLLYVDDRVLSMIDRADRGVPGPRIIVIHAPPRHGKSEYCSKWLPAWFVGRFPERRVMLSSYSDAFSRTWGRRAKEEIQRSGREYFDVGIAPGSRAANEWEIAGNVGGMTTSGIGGSLTGRGANLLIVDDPIKNAEEAISDVVRASQWEWWQSTAWTRLEPNAVALIIMTRWHEDDLAGKVSAWCAEEGIEVEQISLPAIAEDDDLLGRKPGEPLWPERLDLKELFVRKAMLDAYWWGAVYQGTPGAYGVNEWPKEYFDDILVDANEWPDTFAGSVIALDPSKGKNTKRGDYSALAFVGFAAGSLWVDVDIARRPVPKLCLDAVRFVYTRGCDLFGVEANAFQDLLVGPLDEAARDLELPPIPTVEILNTTNKELRISRLGPWLHRKKLKIRKSRSAELLIRQMRDFPNGKHDDGPDALEMAIRLLRHNFENVEESIPDELQRF